MGRRILFDESRCTHCHLCTMFCSLAFGEKGRYQVRPFIARIRVAASEDDTRYAAHVCLQCTAPACVEACPVEALTRDEAEGVVFLDEAACIGCGSCVEACALGGIFMAGDVAVKCEVCDDPLCVRACAQKALSLGTDTEADGLDLETLYREVPL